MILSHVKLAGNVDFMIIIIELAMIRKRFIAHGTNNR